MALIKNYKGFETVSITSADGLTELTLVPSRGAVVSSIMMPGNKGPRELLFQHDNFWDKGLDDLPGGMPLAFPVFARLERSGKRGAYLYDGKLYQLPIHGFGWQQAWKLEAHSASRVTISLTDNAEMRRMYPFRFSVSLEYEVRPQQVICHQTYTNLDDKPMPYSAGFHPYFLTPEVGSGKEAVLLDYEPLRRFVYNEQMTDLIGEAPVFSLPKSVTDKALNEQLTSVGVNKEIKITYPDGDCLHLCATGVEDSHLFSYVQLYTIEDKAFFCAEPIMSPPNALNTVSGMRWLAPGRSEHGLFKLWL